MTASTAHTAVTGPGGEGTRLARAGDLLAAEWLKLRTVRSSYLMIVAAYGVALFVAIGIADLNVSPAHPSRPDLAGVVAYSFKGFAIAQLVMAVFGSLTITAEYGSGLIRTTFTAKPQRVAVLAAKTAVAGAAALVAGEVLAFACFLSSQAVLAGHGGASLWAPRVLPAVLGGGFYLAVVAVMGVGIGAMLRHTAAAITVSAAFLYLVPSIAGSLPYPWNWDFGNAFPSTAAQQITSVAVSPHSHIPPVPACYALLAAYAIGVPCLGAWLLRRRDA